MNNNISVKYREYKEKKSVALGHILTEGFVEFISAMIFGAEYTAYALCYIFNAVYTHAASFKRTALYAMLANAAKALAVVLVCVAFFGVVGGMEAGTISLTSGAVTCIIMCLCLAFAVYKRK
ncbi:MAG: hypothetical protein IKT65_05420 [Clostridia bacterium]|nr:hypothetical protein [Clostridia bacterium]